MQCPSNILYTCRCPMGGQIRELRGVSYYPMSRMIRIGNSLHALHCISNGGMHYVNAMMDAISSGRVEESATFLLSGLVCKNLVVRVRDSLEGSQLLWWTIFHSNRQALTIQRWFRRMLGRGERRLALAMALHPRLGQGSPLVALCTDQLCLIGKLI